MLQKLVTTYWLPILGIAAAIWGKDLGTALEKHWKTVLACAVILYFVHRRYAASGGLNAIAASKGATVGSSPVLAGVSTPVTGSAGGAQPPFFGFGGVASPVVGSIDSDFVLGQGDSTYDQGM